MRVSRVVYTSLISGRTRRQGWTSASSVESLRSSSPSGTRCRAASTNHQSPITSHFPSRVVGFVQVGPRSHADGCDTSRPVGFIEGWYVVPDCRRQGIGRRLLAAAEDWASNQGCEEMGSDTQIDNEISQTAHWALGYQVVDRCVHFRKRL